MYKESLKSMLWGLVAIIFGFFLWLNIAGNPFEELDLILRAKVTDGFIINTWEDVEDYGKVIWYHSFYYEYQIPDGRKFNKASETFSGRLPEEFWELEQPYVIEVEYLPDNPEISRIKGTGTEDIAEWLWRKVGFGGILLIAFLSPGFIVLTNGIRKLILLKHIRNQ